MAFWQENYSFIKDVYETRICKMIEWMDHLEMAISKVNYKQISYHGGLQSLSSAKTYFLNSVRLSKHLIFPVLL